MSRLYEVRLPDLDGQPRWRRAGIPDTNKNILLGLEPEDTDFPEIYAQLKTIYLERGQDVWNYRPLFDPPDDQPPEAA